MNPLRVKNNCFKDPKRCSTGVEGFDEVLGGGLPCNRLYVLEGQPGSGKTTLAIQFLLEGIKKGEKALYITFSETEDELNSVADSHGWDLRGLQLVDLSYLEKQISPDTQNTLFHPSEIELARISQTLLDKIESISPDRIVFDSVSEMRLLAESPLRYRRQVLALKQSLTKRRSTVLFLDDLTGSTQDLQVQSIAHGVIRLSRLHHEFGGERRQMKIIKLRGVKFISGNHDFEIDAGGARVFPRMISSRYQESGISGRLPSGIQELDALLGGGLDRGTASLLIGPAGTGKSTLALQYALAAAAGGENVVFFCFDETVANLLKRSDAIGMKIDAAVQSGALSLQKIDPAELSPGAFSRIVQERVENEHCKVVVIDSLNGYIQAMPQEQFLTLQLHELLAYLNNQGVVTVLTLAQHGMIGTMTSPIDLTYLADTVILTRFFEASGSIKKAISVIKKRTGSHESTIRELAIDQYGIRVGNALSEFQGILTGVPRYVGGPESIMKPQRDF